MDITILRDLAYGKELIETSDSFRVVWLDDMGNVELEEFDEYEEASKYYESL